MLNDMRDARQMQADFIALVFYYRGDLLKIIRKKLFRIKNIKFLEAVSTKMPYRNGST